MMLVMLPVSTYIVRSWTAVRPPNDLCRSTMSRIFDSGACSVGASGADAAGVISATDLLRPHAVKLGILFSQDRVRLRFELGRARARGPEPLWPQKHREYQDDTEDERTGGLQVDIVHPGSQSPDRPWPGLDVSSRAIDPVADVCQP